MKFSLTSILLLIVILAICLNIWVVHDKNSRFEFFVHNADPADASWLIKKELVDTGLHATAWHLEDDDPPLSVGKAVSICESIASEMNLETASEKIGSWKLKSLAIVPFDFHENPPSPFSNSSSKLAPNGIWFYLAQIEGSYQVAQEEKIFSSSGPPPETIQLLILMNGKVFVSEKGRWKDSLEWIVQQSNEIREYGREERE